MTSVSISRTIFELLQDSIDGGSVDYEEHSRQIADLEEYLLLFSGETGISSPAIKQSGGILAYDTFYEVVIEPIMEDFEEYVLHDGLPNILAWRDFNNDHPDEEQTKMAEKNGDFFGAELFPYEEKYLDEFEKNGFDRLFIKEENNKKGTPSPYL